MTACPPSDVIDRPATPPDAVRKGTGQWHRIGAIAEWRESNVPSQFTNIHTVPKADRCARCFPKEK